MCVVGGGSQKIDLQNFQHAHITCCSNSHNVSMGDSQNVP